MNTNQLKTSEYGQFYAGYIKVLGEVDLLEEMKNRKNAFNQLLGDLRSSDLHFRYAPGKWTIGQVILHITDAERVFQYRALRIGRGDQTPLPGYDQDLYVPNSDAEHRSLESLTGEFNQVRNSSLTLFEHFTDNALLRMGRAGENEVSVRALGFMICGHQKHHEQILQSRYLGK